MVAGRKLNPRVAINFMELTLWFVTFDHTNYAPWIQFISAIWLSYQQSIHKLPTYLTLTTVQKTKVVFLLISIDQDHKQNNAFIKGDGVAVALTDNACALQRWMVAGPEIARVIEEAHERWGKLVETRHPDKTASVQTIFANVISKKEISGFC